MTDTMQRAATYMHKGLKSIEQGNLDAAIAAFREAVAIQPYPDIFYNLGTALSERGDNKEAIDCYHQVIALAPNYLPAYYNLGILWHRLGDLEKAITCFQTILQIQPDSAEAHQQLAALSIQQFRIAEAIHHARRAVALQPDSAAAWCALGTALAIADSLEEATISLQRAIAIAPDLIDAYLSLGSAFAKQKKHQQALESYNLALQLQPEALEVRENRGSTLLLLENFVEGLQEYEWRWRRSELKNARANFPYAEWDGADLANKTILVWAEQGIGEEILFASVYPRLIAACRRCILVCNPRLVSLFARSFPQTEVITLEQFAANPTRFGSIDFQSAAGSLLRWFIPLQQPTSYLRAGTRQPGGKGLKVGISWHSVNPKKQLVALAAWEPILAIPGICWISLQYGDRREEIAEVERRLDIKIYQDPTTDPLGDLDDVASQIAGLDLAISVSNSTAHLAGALGKPVWVLLSHSPELWYWGLDREDCLWYPSARMFRQLTPGGWNELLQRVAQTLVREFGDFSFDN